MKKSKTHALLPERNSLAEAFIYAGGVGLISVVIAGCVVVLVANMFNVTANSIVGVVSLVVLAICALLVWQAIMTFREWQRVDRYRLRLIALVMILAWPVLMALHILMANAQTAILLRGGVYSQVPYAIFEHIFRALAPVLLIVSLAGVIMYVVLLLKKDKLFWSLEGNPRTKIYRDKEASLFRRKRLGSLLLFAPIIVGGLFLILAIIAGSSGGSSSLYAIAFALRGAFLIGVIPCVVAGIVVLARNK